MALTGLTGLAFNMAQVQEHRDIADASEYSTASDFASYSGRLRSTVSVGLMSGWFGMPVNSSHRVADLLPRIFRHAFPSLCLVLVPLLNMAESTFDEELRVALSALP